MDRYIKLDKLFDILNEAEIPHNKLVERVINSEAEETADRPRGKWKITPVYIQCSVCGGSFLLIPQNFCPNCGADMRGDNYEAD